MKRLSLSLALTRSAVVTPLLDGDIEVEGVDLVTSIVSPGDLFWRQLHHQEFDVSEFSLSSLLILADNGDPTWHAIPVFPTRSFFHTQILVRSDSGINVPGDLKGRRVGVPEYQQTAALWTRAALQHEFGVFPNELDWVMGRQPLHSHAEVTGFEPPAGLRLSTVRDGETLGSLVAAGKLDALIAYRSRNSGLGLGLEPNQSNDRSATEGPGIVGTETADLKSEGKLRRLFANPTAEGIRYFKSTGMFPVNHVIVIRDSLVRQHPWLPRNLYEAFCRSKELAFQRLHRHLELYAALGAVELGRVDDTKRALSFGLRTNRPLLTAAIGYAVEQELLRSSIVPEDLFFPSVLES
ncbi:MAG: hypothetical protein HKL84_05980 [Acidimicrobiaceae bacterium]|nr:hypothetical protein [Acidimicrobiaceae bacterium]